MNSHTAPKSYKSVRCKALQGAARVPGDKSISHRSIMFGGLAAGETLISGLLEGEDVHCTIAAMQAMGARIRKSDDGLWRVVGTGLGKLQEPADVLYMGNSGTSTRLLAGLIGGHGITAFMNGDVSLSKRPMKRIIGPLEQMGVRFLARQGNLLPMAVTGTAAPKAISYDMPVASAQVKSAILLAGLTGDGVTEVHETVATRDHSENMLRHFGATIDSDPTPEGGRVIRLQGGPTLTACAVDVPADISAAAFPIVAALLVEGSSVKLPAVGMNPLRTGIIDTLLDMGASIEIRNRQIQAGEPVADLVITGTGPLKGVTVPEARVPSMIDEFPVLAVLASCAEGTTHMTGLAELRVKESDRLALMAQGLKACGVNLEMGEDSLTIHGTGKPPKGGAFIETALDHRIAMSFLVLGCATDEPVEIDDIAPVRTSFPNFVSLMNGLGAALQPTDGLAPDIFEIDDM